MNRSSADRYALVMSQMQLCSIGCSINAALRAVRRMRQVSRTGLEIPAPEIEAVIRRLAAVQEEVRDAINAIDDHASEPVGTQTLLAIG